MSCVLRTLSVYHSLCLAALGPLSMYSSHARSLGGRIDSLSGFLFYALSVYIYWPFSRTFPAHAFHLKTCPVNILLDVCIAVVVVSLCFLLQVHSLLFCLRRFSIRLSSLVPRPPSRWLLWLRGYGKRLLCETRRNRLRFFAPHIGWMGCRAMLFNVVLWLHPTHYIMFITLWTNISRHWCSTLHFAMDE